MVPHPPNDLERELFSLPISLGGLGICDPHQASRNFYEFSRKLSRPLVDLILQQCDTLPHDVIDSQYHLFENSLRLNIRIRWIEHSQFFLALLTIYVKLWNAVRRRAHLHGCLLLRLHSMVLYFIRLTLCLRYGWSLPHLPSHCVCGKAFTISHALSCPYGAFPIIRHNDVRELTAKLMSEVCHDVQVEPHLQPLSGELLHHKTTKHEDNARVNIRAAGFWGCRHYRFF